MSQGAAGGLVLDRFAIEWLVAHLVRSERVFRAGLDYLNESCFKPGELIYREIWQATKAYYVEYNTLPTSSILKTAVASRLQATAEITEDEHNDAMDYLDWVFGNEFADVDQSEAIAIDLLRHFLMQRLVGFRLQQVASTAAVSPIVELPGSLQTLYDEMLRISSVANYSHVDTIPGDWSINHVDRMPTGIDFIDSRLRGGMEPGEVYVLLGPTGVGKTTLSMQTCCSYANNIYERVLQGGERRFAAYFFYEGGMDEMIKRALSCSALIPKDRLDSIRSFDELTTSQNPLPYERELFPAGEIPGERERKDAASVWLNQYLRIFDFSGNREPGRPVLGFGGISEIRQHLEMARDHFGYGPGFVVIDWAGTCVRRYLQSTGLAKNGDYSQRQTLELTQFVDRCHYEIAAPLDCTVLVAHQLRGAVNNKPPTFEFSHADAEGCASFAVNAWFSFVLGTKDRRTNTCIFRATKTRRSEDPSSTICYIDGQFGRLVDASDRYRIDSVTRRIISMHEASMLDEGDDATSATPALPDVGY